MRLNAFIYGGLFAALFIICCGILNCAFDLFINILRDRTEENFWTTHLYAVTIMTHVGFIIGGIINMFLDKIKRCTNVLPDRR